MNYLLISNDRLIEEKVSINTFDLKGEIYNQVKGCTSFNATLSKHVVDKSTKKEKKQKLRATEM
ncbi:PACS2 [Acrasis kona]|uniref:PACS2 n=1 Tax=Acrasis kona TaxID=1008807 RepID=A0AAW2ZB84_9EUKA